MFRRPNILQRSANCWKRTRPRQKYPQWLNSYLEEDYVDSEDHDLLEYIIRLTPLRKDVSPPELDEETKWCGVFDIRRPELCPMGIPRSLVTRKTYTTLGY